MSAKDKIHEAVKNALIKDGWTITHDPYLIDYEEVNLYADLGAEQTIAAEQNERGGHCHMDKLNTYRTIIKNRLTAHAELINRYPRPNIETSVAFDEQRDHYFLFKLGWTERGRVRGIIIHLRLRQSKIYIEEDWTEDGIATDLLAAGVPKEDIVLAFHPPEMRPYTEFAVA